jgi:hypothetical protein
MGGEDTDGQHNTFSGPSWVSHPLAGPQIFALAHWQRYALKHTGRDIRSSTLEEIFAQELYQIYRIQLLKHITVTETRSTTFADEFAEMVKGEGGSATMRQH